VSALRRVLERHATQALHLLPGDSLKLSGKTLDLVNTNKEHMIILTMQILDLVAMFVYNSTCVMWRSAIDQSQDLMCTKLILTSLIMVYLTQCDEALRDLDINSAWMYIYSSIAF